MEKLHVLHLTSKQTLITMKNQTNFKVSIPKPCHEDWSKFTPDEKGAFCKVCSKSVHDFTKKSDDEIQSILVEQILAGNKVCGRFNEDQLESPQNTFPELSSYSLNFQKIKKFAIALFLVFGSYLFNSIKSSAQKVGKIAYTCRIPVKGEVSIPTPSVDTIKSSVEIDEVIGDVAIEPETKLQIMGGVKAINIEEVLGEPSISPVLIGATLVEFTANPEQICETAVLEIDNKIPEVISENEFAVPESTNVVTEKNPTNDAESNFGFSVKSFPNPTSGVVNIKYIVPEPGLARLQIFDLNGKLIKTLLPPTKLYAAEYNAEYDLRDLQDGVYFITFELNVKKTTQRIILSK